MHTHNSGQGWVSLGTTHAAEAAQAPPTAAAVHGGGASGPEIRVEYGVPATSLEGARLTVAQMFRGRADVENAFDRLKNEWGSEGS